MKVAERPIEKEGTLQGEQVGMTIDVSAFAHIMSVLTNLYSDPERALIREYSTNALDAHIEAGNSAPIEVTLPTDLSPFLSIKDYGVGMDAEGIRDIYSRYGTSTKRDSDDVVGMLGLGCKSALTYCDQFTLVGTKDGLMTTVAVGRDEDGGGTMTIVDCSATSEPNGLEVVIPVKRGNRFREKALDFFKYWQPGTVLVNGTEPSKLDGTPITDDAMIVTGAAESQVIVVMGNVPYPVNEEFCKLFPTLGLNSYDHYIVARVPIGGVHFTPSRESLQYTRQTKDTLTELGNRVTAEFRGALIRGVADATSTEDALAQARVARSLGVPQALLLWKGRQVMDSLTRDSGIAPGSYVPRDHANTSRKSYLVAQRHHRRGRGYRKTGERTWSIPISQPGPYNGSPLATHVFENFDGMNLTETKRAKIEQYLDALGREGTDERWVFVDKLTADEKFWLPAAHDWDKVKLERVTATKALIGKRITGSYWGLPPKPGRSMERWHYAEEVAADKIDPKKLIWEAGGKHIFSNGQSIKRHLVPDDYWVVAIPANRQDKFLRDFPAAVRIRDWSQKAVEAEWAKIPDAQKKARTLQLANRYDRGWVLALKNETIDDPDLADYVRLMNTDTSAAEKVAEAARSRSATLTYPKEARDFNNVLAKYPLLGALGTVSAKAAPALAFYLNQAHAA